MIGLIKLTQSRRVWLIGMMSKVCGAGGGGEEPFVGVGIQDQ